MLYIYIVHIFLFTYYIILKGHFSLLLEKEEGEGEIRRKKEKSMWERNDDRLPNGVCPDGGSNPQPGYVLWLGSEPVTFWSIRWYSKQLGHKVRTHIYFIKIICFHCTDILWLKLGHRQNTTSLFQNFSRLYIKILFCVQARIKP